MKHLGIDSRARPEEIKTLAEPDRLERERKFHNDAFSKGTRAKVKKYYSITTPSHAKYRELLQDHSPGESVLEYGSGPGSQAFSLAKQGANVTAIDISDVAISQAREHAEQESLPINFIRMNAEDLDFPDQSFGVVCGSGILHHLNLESALSEIHRVLKPNGRGIFFEPLGHNPFINAYRALTSGLRTEDEHPLLTTDLDLARSIFSHVSTHHYHMVSLAATVLPWPAAKATISSILNTMDQAIFTRIPIFRRYAWIVVIELRK